MPNTLSEIDNAGRPLMDSCIKQKDPPEPHSMRGRNAGSLL
ncbi:hypothetical protein SAMN04489740_4318 [Arthrobacter alpinus]|uniref:Uncharacterized protein n=1 Tax=Arthrobacter alpinus TaxID=656366 RepID=A0A1H5PGL9_9MICC|nr:hypothetical protein SAMN04489740_4318 [Arthrobacter alpinus]